MKNATLFKTICFVSHFLISYVFFVSCNKQMGLDDVPLDYHECYVPKGESEEIILSN